MDDVVERRGGEITPLDITDAVSTKCLENAEKDDGGRVVNGGVIHGLQVALQFKQWEADALRADITRLSADLEEARKALEPFATAANGFDRKRRRGQIVGVGDDFRILSNLTVGDLRRARNQFEVITDGK